MVIIPRDTTRKYRSVVLGNITSFFSFFIDPFHFLDDYDTHTTSLAEYFHCEMRERERDRGGTESERGERTTSNSEERERGKQRVSEREREKNREK